MPLFWRRLREAVTQRRDWELYKLKALTDYVRSNNPKNNIYFDHAIYSMAAAMRDCGIPADMPIAHVIDLLIRMRAVGSQ